MHADQTSLKMLDSVYHAGLRFLTNSNFRTHHSLYASVHASISDALGAL